jgi:sarcosine oxidase subunit beta
MPLAEKAIVCACEDVSVHDVEDAIAHGFGDIESLKRYTGLGTGPCQGKSCQAGAMRICAAKEAVPPEARVPFRARPPQSPTPVAAYAGLPEEVVAPASGTRAPSGLRPTWGKGPHPLQPRTALPEHADVVIIGGGIMGLSLAWNLAAQGAPAQKILVLERGYLCEGASGRNGGGVRATWGTPTLIELAKESIVFMGRFAQELGINVWLRKGGYLFLANDEEMARRLELGAELQKRHGLPTRMISPGEAGEIVPELDTSKFIAASWNAEDGVVFPWPFVWGYADGARKRGVAVETFTRVTGIETAGGRVRAVQTDRGRVASDRVVIACGAWSPVVARLAGVELPNVPYRHEIVSSEPLKPFLGPLVSNLGTGLYFSQSMRGEIVGGMGDPREEPGLNQSSSLRFLARYARALCEVLPRAGAVKLLRQWAGCYDVTPDHSPVLGETPGVAGLLQMSGFVGHGFMMAPAVGRRMAAWMGGGKEEIFERFNLRRFAEGRLETETFIIG